MHLRRAGRPGFISFTATVLAVALAAGCGGGGGLEPPRDLSLREDFSECSGFTMNDEVATVDCPEGELRVLVEQPQASPSHFVPFRAETTQRSLDV